MSQDSATNADQPITSMDAIPPLRASDYLWRPWYAKLWWAGIGVYWTCAALSFSNATLAVFFESALAGYLNILFLPMTALAILGFGFARAWLDRAEWVDDDEERRFGRAVGAPPPEMDILDPRSGFLWINHPRNRARRGGH